MKILIVEDEEHIADGLKFNLEAEGYEPVVAGDGETGLDYNYFRDYEPNTGRYIGSDPIGLVGGISTFAYASSRPTTEVDPHGLSADNGFWPAWDHYCDGTGTPWSIAFNLINWGDAVSLAKMKVRQAAAATGCIPGVQQISNSFEGIAQGTYKFVIGRNTISSEGTLVTHCDCSWSYTGSLRSLLGHDLYNFNPSNRGAAGEVATWIGRNRPFCKNTPFEIYLPGSIPITLSGFNSGLVPNSCCDQSTQF